MAKRAFLIVLDSFGIGGAPDAAQFGDAGSDTLAAVQKSPLLVVPNMAKLGLFNIDGVCGGPSVARPAGAFARLVETSRGKDTTIGHWEIAGVESATALPVFPQGFPPEVMREFEQRTGRKTLCNRPYSGTEVIREYGEEQRKTGALIVYTSADSVFQVAANEDVIPLAELYRCCEIAREMLQGAWGVGRVIARPFVGDSAENFRRTANRHDYSLPPPRPAVLDALQAAGHAVIGVGKIQDIFAGQGVTETHKTAGNRDGMQVTQELAGQDFAGLCFVNLVDFDMVFGHRNDVDGYAAALSEFDLWLGETMLPALRKEDLLLITADHGCDPSTPSTDHSRECVPLLAVGAGVKPGANAGTQRSFGCVANTLAEYFQLPAMYAGRSLWPWMAK